MLWQIICWWLVKTAHSWQPKIAHFMLPAFSPLSKPTEKERRGMHDWEIRIRLRHHLGVRMSRAELSRRFGMSQCRLHCWMESARLVRDLGSGETQLPPVRI